MRLRDSAAAALGHRLLHLAFGASMRRGVEALRQPLFLLLFLRLVEEFCRRWAAMRRISAARQRVLYLDEGIDTEFVQGCLLSTEHLLNLGRVEKRTLYTRTLLDLLGGNEFLAQETIRAARACFRRGTNCIVPRLLPPEVRYHVLQAGLNATSSMFGPNFVHFNALNGETSNLFRSTWYCLTIMTPTRPESRSPDVPRGRKSEAAPEVDATCTFTDMSRKPHATLRIVIVNESELRRIADGKLAPPRWGFFNSRHAERYRMLGDLARNFHMQLLRTPTDNRAASSRSPFTSEKAHPPSRPDGGYIKRVQSESSLSSLAIAEPSGKLGSLSRLGRSADSCKTSGWDDSANTARKDKHRSIDKEADGDIGEENCFLRMHVPHFVGPSRA